MPIQHWTNSMSNLFGEFANKKFPSPIQRLINKLYAAFLNLDLSEFHDVGSYESLNALFTRNLIRERAFDDNPSLMISPVDSLITVQGQLKNDTLLQIKGIEYSINRLLTKHATHLPHILNGDFITFYLLPANYHRYHAPTSFQLKKLIHVPGMLYPVRLQSVKKRKSLFVQNERVVLECEHQTGNIFYLVFIGATNVGKMVFHFEPGVETNTTRSVQVYEYAKKLFYKGECLGYFKMGSTVVMVSQKNFLELNARINQKVKFGDVVAQIKI